jgi:outer membrane immunogenic protein
VIYIRLVVPWQIESLSTCNLTGLQHVPWLNVFLSGESKSYDLRGYDAMKKCVWALLWSSVLISAANAADLGPSYKTPVLAPAPVSTWTGFYIGGNIGYGWGDVSLSDFNIVSMSPSGVNGGFQLGYNWQVNNVVFGLEGDFQFADHNDSVSASDPTIPASASLEVKSDWFATVRGRLGYAFGQFMPYVTGGIAFTQAKANLDASAPGATLSVSSDKTSVGYAVGGGVEYAFNRNWSLKAEYLHLGFGSQTYDFEATAAIPALGVVAGATASGDVKLDFDIARVGVNYRF